MIYETKLTANSCIALSSSMNAVRTSSARTSTRSADVAVRAFRLTSWIETCMEGRDRAQQAELRIACFSDNPTKVKDRSVG